MSQVCGAVAACLACFVVCQMDAELDLGGWIFGGIKVGLGPGVRKTSSHQQYRSTTNIRLPKTSSDLLLFLQLILRSIDITTYKIPLFQHNNHIKHTMSSASSYRQSTSTMAEKDNMSTKSTSTVASTVALIKSYLPSKRYTKPATPKSKETPQQKSQRKAIEAEARYYAFR